MQLSSSLPRPDPSLLQEQYLADLEAQAALADKRARAARALQVLKAHKLSIIDNIARSL